MRTRNEAIQALAHLYLLENFGLSSVMVADPLEAHGGP